MFHFLPVAIRYDGSSPTKGHGYQVHIGPMYADTRGWVRIRSTRPEGPPVDAVQLPVHPTDRREWVEAIRVARDILNQPAFAPYNDGELSPGPEVETDEQILDWVRADAETALHPSCTAAMGVEERSVVDPASMRVHGLEGLRVVDASVFPYVTNGNIYAPVMMVAEKAADLIAGNTPLPPPTCRGTDTATAAPSTRPATRATTRRPRTTEDQHDRITEPEPHRVPPSGDAALSVREPLEDLRQGPTGSSATPDADLSRADLKEKTGCVVGVKDVSFDVAPGEVFVVMGLSGSGKSTLVRLLTRLIEPTAGEVVIDGDDITRPARASCATCAAPTPRWSSSTSACCRTARCSTTSPTASRSAASARRSAGRRRRRSSSWSGLKGYERSYPDQLSGGMQQRVGLARALANDPSLLLFDEPFSALDPLIRRDMQNEVIRLHHELGKTMVFITHDLAEALKLGDRILIMRDGAIVQIGTPDEVVGPPRRRLRQGLRLRGAQVPRADPQVGDARARGPASRSRVRRCRSDTIVRQAARAALASEHPIRVMDGDTLLGVVDEEDIMRVVVAEEQA